MGWNLALLQIYSKFLALQIKAIEEGYATEQIGKTNGVVNGCKGYRVHGLVALFPTMMAVT